MAFILYGLRRAISIPTRPGMVRRPLFVRAKTDLLTCWDADRSARSVNHAENRYTAIVSEPYIDGVFPRSVSD